MLIDAQSVVSGSDTFWLLYDEPESSTDGRQKKGLLVLCDLRSGIARHEYIHLVTY